MADTTARHQPTKRRQKDNNGHQQPSNEAMEIFTDAVTHDRGRGRVTRSAQKAYPMQTKRSAAVTGSRLLTHPKIQAKIKARMERAAQAANITRQEIVGMLAEISRASLDDMLDKDGDLNWKTARERGVDHLIKEVIVTDRHSKDGSRRRTVTYKVNDKIPAMNLLADILGLKKEAAKNPLTAAIEAFLIMRDKAEYADIPDDVLAKLQAEQFGVAHQEILAAK